MSLVILLCVFAEVTSAIATFLLLLIELLGDLLSLLICTLLLLNFFKGIVARLIEAFPAISLEQMPDLLLILRG